MIGLFGLVWGNLALCCVICWTAVRPERRSWSVGTLVFFFFYGDFLVALTPTYCIGLTTFFFLAGTLVLILGATQQQKWLRQKPHNKHKYTQPQYTEDTIHAYDKMLWHYVRTMGVSENINLHGWKHPLILHQAGKRKVGHVKPSINTEKQSNLKRNTHANSNNFVPSEQEVAEIWTSDTLKWKSRWARTWVVWKWLNQHKNIDGI